MLVLKKEEYSGKVVDMLQADGVNVRATTFRNGDATATTHYHKNSQVSFVLQGGVLDKRNTWETERLPGELMFFHAGEPHQTIIGSFPSRETSNRNYSR